MTPAAGESRPELRILLAGRGRHVEPPGFLAALDRRYEVVGTLRPGVGRATRSANIVRSIYPNRDGWRARAGLHPRAFRQFTADAVRRLGRWEDRYDLIMLMQTLFSPGSPADSRRYVIFTDNIYSLTQRYYPAWAPLGRRAAAERVRLEQATCRGARHVFANSDFLRDALVDDYGCDPARVVTVGVGANTLARSLEGKRYDAQAALFVGTDFKRKGGDTLLRAWSSVRERLPQAELWVVGPKTGPPSAAQQPGVRWHGLIADRKRLAELYDQAQAFVLPSLFEPFGRSIFEAMGHGLPCIGTDRGGIGETIEPGVDGLIVPAGEPEPLADALVQLLGDSDLACRMGSEAHDKVLGQYTWEGVVARMAPYVEAAASGA